MTLGRAGRNVRPAKNLLKHFMFFKKHSILLEVKKDVKMHKEAARVLQEFPEFFITKTRRHYRITNPLNGSFVITSSTPSGCRFVDNFRADLRRLRNGNGYAK